MHFDKRIHSHVRDWLIVYAGWLRQELVFPIRVHTYCKFGKRILDRSGQSVFGVIHTSDDHSTNPVIWLACGDFSLKEPITDSMEDEIDSIILTFMHELIHYYQYINGFDMDRTKSLEWQATYYAKRIYRRFLSLYD